MTVKSMTTNARQIRGSTRPADYVHACHCILTARCIYQVRFRRHIDDRRAGAIPAVVARWEERVARQRTSGFSVAEFCRRERIHPVTFHGLAPATGWWVETGTPCADEPGFPADRKAF